MVTLFSKTPRTAIEEKLTRAHTSNEFGKEISEIATAKNDKPDHSKRNTAIALGLVFLL